MMTVVLLAIAGAIFWFYQPLDRWNNSVLDRAEECQVHPDLVRAMDAIMLILSLIMTFGLLPSIFGGTPANVTDILGIRDQLGEALFWLGSMALGMIVSSLLIWLTKVLWMMVGYYGGRAASKAAVFGTKIVAAVLLYVLYSTIGGLITYSLAPVLATTSRIPDYTLITIIVQILNVGLVVNGLLSPLTPTQMKQLRLGNLLAAVMDADRYQVMQLAMSGNGYQLPILDDPTPAKRVPTWRARKMLSAVSRAASRRYSDHLLEMDGQYYLDPNALPDGDGRKVVNLR